MKNVVFRKINLNRPAKLIRDQPTHTLETLVNTNYLLYILHVDFVLHNHMIDHFYIP